MQVGGVENSSDSGIEIFCGSQRDEQLLIVNRPVSLKRSARSLRFQIPI